MLGDGGTKSRRDLAPGPPKSPFLPAHGRPRGELPAGRRFPRVATTAMNTKEIVLGLGPQDSLWSVVRLAEEQLRAAHGSPRVVLAQAPAVEMEATRPHF